MHPLMNDTRADELKDQEKRLFLEEYRYVGQQTVGVIVISLLLLCCLVANNYDSIAVRASSHQRRRYGTNCGFGN